MASTADGLPRTYSEELPKPRKFSMAELGHKLKSKNTWFGKFDYGFLCTPSWPYCRTQSRSPPQFFGTYDHLGIVTALFMGLQHCLAMTGGLITPPLLVGLASSDPVVQNYLVQAAMLVCAFTTFIQVCGPKIPRLPMLGTGILSVMGVSFASVSTFQNSIAAMMAAGNTFPQAYGRMMGTSAVCCVIPMFISFVPYKYLKRVFPPIVLGVTIMLIGINLTGSGLLNWGGGSYCGTNYKFLPVEQPCTITNNGASYNSTCYDANIIVTCTGNGFVMLPFGSAVYVGLGFLTYATIVVIEIFGSPFMRNGAVVIALLFGYLIAAVTPGPGGQRYVNTALIDAAPVGTFLWTTTFPWGIYTPALIPLFIIFLITSIETMGDVSATEEASRLEVSGPVHTARIKGGLRNDCCSSFFSAVAGSMPITTFAQNNGVISLTGVASRQAGFACALWLLLLGIFGKFGGWVLSIPNCVLGGMTTFLFANVISSGIKILVSHGPLTRRDRFILACSLGLGIGISIVPYFFENAMWPADPSYSEGLASLQAAILNVLATPFCVGALIALTLNLVLPVDAPEVVPVTSDASDSKHVTLFEKQTSAGSRDGSLSGPSDDKAPTTALHLHLDKQQAGGMAGRGDGVGAGAYTPPAPQAAMLSDD